MADITAVPGRLDITVYAGLTKSIELTWPSGSLDGSGPWTAAATLGDVNLALPVTVDGDVQTISLPPETVAHLHQVGAWRLTDTSNGNVRIAGIFRVTNQPGPSVVAATVQLVDETVTVSVLSDAPVSSVNGETGEVVLDAADVGADPAGTAAAGDAAHAALTVQDDGVHGGPLSAGDVGADPAGSAATVQANLDSHEQALLSGDVHGVVEHNWGRHAWADLAIVVRTPDPAADWQRTVQNGRGVVTAVQPSGGGSLRTVAMHPATSWADGEIRSLILPPSQWLGTNTQMGHSHRLREISPGVWEAINIWTSIVFGGTYADLLVASVRNDGVNPTLQSATANDTGNETASIDRRSAIRAHTRFSFGANFNAYRVVPTRGLLTTLAAGDLVTIADMADTTFNETSVPLDGGPDLLAEQVRVIDPTHSTAVPWTHDFAGHITPSGVSAMKRWAPFYLATRVRGGTTSSVPVEIKRWRKGEPEPGWDDPRVRRVDVVPNANVPAMPLGPGLHGILDAHLHSSTSQSWGDLQFRRL